MMHSVFVFLKSMVYVTIIIKNSFENNCLLPYFVQLNILKTDISSVCWIICNSIIHLTLTWNVGSLACICDRFACIYTWRALVYSLIYSFIKSAQNFSGEISGQVRSLARSGSPSTWWPRSVTLRFWVPMISFCTTNSVCVCVCGVHGMYAVRVDAYACCMRVKCMRVSVRGHVY